MSILGLAFRGRGEAAHGVPPEPERNRAMTTTIATPTLSRDDESTSSKPSLFRTTVKIGFAAAAATTAVAAAIHAAGVPLEVSDGPIPLAAFAQLTFFGAVLGAFMLVAFNRLSSAPRRRLLQTTTVLTAASCVPSVTLAPAVTTKVALVAMHLLAAAIVVPALARHARG
jgi:hypothetical protein